MKLKKLIKIKKFLNKNNIKYHQDIIDENINNITIYFNDNNLLINIYNNKIIYSCNDAIDYNFIKFKNLKILLKHI